MSSDRENRVSFYTLALFVHSGLRWVILALAVLMIVRSFAAWRQRRAWHALDERLHVALVGLLDLQMLIGLVTYALLSPFVRAFWSDIAIAMKQSGLRFYGIEHVVAMVAAVAVLHIGRKRSMQSPNDAVRHRRVWTTTLAALAIIVLSIPWPGLPYGRPLFRGL